jgi:Lar family restriction alleviation protein
MNTPADALAPCPFCGESNAQVRRENDGAGFRHVVACKCGGAVDAFFSNDDAIAAWNHRTAPRVEPEPVAWQYRVTRDGGGYVNWQSWEREDRPAKIGRWDAEYRPLYTAAQLSTLHAASVRDGGWMPIESAPRDGTRVLIYQQKNTKQRKYWGVFIGFLHTPGNGKDPPFWECEGSSQRLSPTHWQPLPAPPMQPAATPTPPKEPK